jgi:hypothetical protein
MQFAGLWLVLTLAFGLIFYLLEMNYESFARDWYAGMTQRNLTAFEFPGFWANKVALTAYVWWTGPNDHSMWSHPVRILLTLLLAVLAMVSGLISTLCIRKIWPRL